MPPPTTKTIRATITFADKKDVPYEVKLLAKEDTGQYVQLGKTDSVRVDWALADFVKYYGPWWRRDTAARQ
jgi:hypothetical protein